QWPINPLTMAIRQYCVCHRGGAVCLDSEVDADLRTPPVSASWPTSNPTGGKCLEERNRHSACSGNFIWSRRAPQCSAHPGAATGDSLGLPERLPQLLRQRADRRFRRLAVPAEERREAVVVMPAGCQCSERRGRLVIDVGRERRLV